MVRVYLTESRARLERLLQRLFLETDLCGMTAISGVGGFGRSVVLDPDRLAEPDDPPMVLEFFDHPDRVDEHVEIIRSLVAPRHVVIWPATLIESER